FGAAIFLVLGKQKGLEYLTGYVVEYSLSIDNMFVFIVIFSYFAIPKKYQLKVLLFGVLGAIILRFIFIFVGITLLNAFSWTIYIFGVILLFTGLKMLKSGDKENSLENNFFIKFLKKRFRFTDSIESGDFFVRKNGLLYITPIFAAIFVVEATDLIFAVDSIPAVLSITQDTFIVYTSNIFAVLGLRSLYFLLAQLADKFKMLKYGVAVILFFVGIKMLISHYYHINAGVSLGIIVAILLITIFISIRHEKK
ncbi:MAG: TerC/Alx family metal homeostasis membrane protein, partial [Elusimicrobiota bacterium]|nr:TerC/Alx family metal homeostasis membrane protein [Elusimicrobiota bacterium]